METGRITVSFTIDVPSRALDREMARAEADPLGYVKGRRAVVNADTVAAWRAVMPRPRRPRAKVANDGRRHR
jgi:hypothetical protein